MTSVLRAEGLRKRFRSGTVDVEALRGVSLSVNPGEFVAILGVSGSGKSTLLHCLGLVDRPDEGSVRIDGEDAGAAGEARRARWRNTRLGFVFQSFHLVPELNALENVLLPAMIRRGPAGWLAARGEARERARSLLERVGIGPRAAHRPSQLSGGERQRVAVARALMNAPGALLADEPTGNLDSESGRGIVSLLAQAGKEGTAVVMVTHNEELAKRADRVFRMADGCLDQG